MLKKSLYLICFVWLAFSYSACREDNASASADTLVAQARLYFESYVNVPGLAFNKANPLATLSRSVAWNDAYLYELFDGILAVAVPVHFPENNTVRSNITNGKIALSDLTRLLMYQDNTNTWHTEVVTLLPQPGYSGKEGAHFSGVVLVDDWYGNNLKQLQYTPDGKQSILTADATTAQSRKAQRQLYLLSVCITVYGSKQTVGDADNAKGWSRTSCETLHVDDQGAGRYAV